MSAIQEEEAITASGSKWKLVFNESLPPQIRRAMVSEGRARDVRLNDVAGDALASYFKLEWEPSGKSYRVEKAKLDKIKVPEKLWRRIRGEALKVQGGTMRGVVLSILQEHFELEPTISRTRKPRSKKEA